VERREVELELLEGLAPEDGAAEPLDEELVRDVQAIFAPVKNIGHIEGLPENN
jgi:hypothetical protein